MLTVMRRRQKTKTFTPGKSENEGTQRTPSRTRARAGLILLFDGEVGPAKRDHDEHNQADILTSGLKPRSRLPGPLSRSQWLWESVARYSGATVPDSHGVS